jgi:hypothetical protein
MGCQLVLRIEEKLVKEIGLNWIISGVIPVHLQQA